MTTSRKLLAAAITLAAICLIALLVWRLGGTDEPAPQARAPARAAPRAAPPPREPPPGAVPAAPQVSMEDDPVGPLLLEGQVLDSSDDPVAGATVRLSSNPPRSATSAADGSFSFDKLLPRTYALNARRGGEVGGPVLHALRAASDPVIIRLAAGASIEVTVVAAEDGKPIAGAAVALQGTFLAATTDAAGLARLTGVAAVPFATVEATATGRAPGQVLLQIPEARGAAIKTRVELRRGAAVSGTVVDQTGAPVVGARVSERDVSQLLQLADDDKLIKTDAKGRFTLAAVAAGTYRFHATHPKHAPGSSEPRAVNGIQPVAGVRIELAAGARLAGRVVGSDGAPVPWATVRVGPRLSGGPGPADFGTRQATAGERGEFEIEGLPRATLVALAMSEEAASAAVEVDLAAVPDRRDLVLRLDVSGRIEGVVVNSAGQPVAEAQVTAYPDLFAGASLQDFALRGPAVDASDGGGRFAFRGLPDGTYRLQASRSGAANPFSRRTTKAVTGATGVRLVVEREGRIRGRVQFEDGSAPALFSVAAGLAPPLPVASSDGTFELTGVAPGTHDVHVRGPDFAPAVVRDVAVEPDRARDVGTIKVERGRSVSGRVLGARGAPVAGATVVLGEQLLGDGRALSASLMQSFGDQVGFRQTKSDGDGRYSIAGIGAARDLVIAAEHDSQGRSLAVVVPLGVNSSTVDLQLVGFASVAGLVTAGGKPVQAQIIATTPAAIRYNVVVSSGADGRYQIERLAAGEYKLTATVSGGLGGATGSRLAHLEAGKPAQVDIDVPLGDITLLVTVKPKRGTIDSAQVFLFTGAVSARTGREVQEAFSAGAEGGVKHLLGPASAPFRFADMKAGAYSICVIPLTGDLQDPAFAQKLAQHLETLEVHCAPTQLPESPKEQSYTATVPPMAPLE